MRNFALILLVLVSYFTSQAQSVPSDFVQLVNRMKDEGYLFKGLAEGGGSTIDFEMYGVVESSGYNISRGDTPVKEVTYAYKHHGVAKYQDGMCILTNLHEPVDVVYLDPTQLLDQGFTFIRSNSNEGYVEFKDALDSDLKVKITYTGSGFDRIDVTQGGYGTSVRFIARRFGKPDRMTAREKGNKFYGAHKPYIDDVQVVEHRGTCYSYYEGYLKENEMARASKIEAERKATEPSTPSDYWGIKDSKWVHSLGTDMSRAYSWQANNPERLNLRYGSSVTVKLESKGAREIDGKWKVFGKAYVYSSGSLQRVALRNVNLSNYRNYELTFDFNPGESKAKGSDGFYFYWEGGDSGDGYRVKVDLNSNSVKFYNAQGSFLTSSDGNFDLSDVSDTRRGNTFRNDITVRKFKGDFYFFYGTTYLGSFSAGTTGGGEVGVMVSSQYRAVDFDITVKEILR